MTKVWSVGGDPLRKYREGEEKGGKDKGMEGGTGERGEGPSC